MRHDSEAARIRAIIRTLAECYGEVEGFLDHRSNYELLIAVILSAQTTDRQVNLVTPALFLRYPAPADLAAAEVAAIESVIRTIGFFHTKARNIKATAAALVERFGGEVPAEMDELVSLPGVGRKSANVIRGSCFGLPAVIVDTHFGRVATRLGLTTARDPAHIERDVRATVAERDQMRLSMLLNKHGRVVCHARRPECPVCRIARYCPYPAKTV